MITLYHATSLYNSENILKDQMLIPQKSHGVEFIDTDDFENTLLKYRDYIFLTNNFETAKEYGEAFNFNNKGYVIFELLLLEDKLLPDDIDSPNSKTWEESINDIKQVKVKGNLNIDKNTKLHLYLNNEYKIIEL